MYLYHGTNIASARRILKEGFVPDKKYNWNIKSKKGFVYLSLAYAPFYAMIAKGKSKDRAIVKVQVKQKDLYPEDDFVMYALGHPSYTQSQLNTISLEKYKYLTPVSLKYMGNASAKPKDIKVIGATEFDASNLIMICDPVISPLNYKICGGYYKDLTKWIYDGNNPLDFRKMGFETMQW